MRVRHQVLGKAFALKLIKAPIAADPRIREMFYREARLASACSHDHSRRWLLIPWMARTGSVVPARTS